MKQLDELINLQEPGWAFVEEWMNEAINHIEILPKDKARAEEELYTAFTTEKESQLLSQ